MLNHFVVVVEAKEADYDDVKAFGSFAAGKVFAHAHLHAPLAPRLLY
jgi:hypothetical protein